MRAYSIVAAIALVVASVTGVTFATGSAAADEQKTALEDVLDGPDGNETRTAWVASGVETAWAATAGASDRASWWVSAQLPDVVTERFPSLAREQFDPTTEAQAVTTTYNGNNATLETYTTARRNLTSNQTVEIVWHGAEETATRYLLANVSDGNVTSRMVASTSRTPTDTLELCKYAAEESQEELEYFVTEYAEPGEDVDAKYKARLKGRYGSDVETTLFPSSGSCSADGGT